MDRNSQVMFATHNALPENVRKKVALALDVTLAASIDLWTHAKHAHWNVKGVHFISLHKLFDEVASKSQVYIDMIAERIAQLGGIAEGTLDAVSRKSPLPKYPINITDGEEHTHALASSLGAFGRHLKNKMEEFDELKDYDTVDILTEASRGIDELLWFVEAHVQTQPIGAGASARSQPRGAEAHAG